MAETTIALLPSTSQDPREGRASVAVYTKKFWNEKYWVLQPEVVCDSITLTTGDKISTCQLTRKFGPAEMPFGETAWRKIDPVDWRDYRVLVEVTQNSVTKAFYFIVTNQQTTDRKRQGTGFAEREGMQIFGCHGFELDLRRTRVEKSFGVALSYDNTGIRPKKATSGEVTVFNDPRRGGVVNNRPKPNRYYKSEEGALYRFDFNLDKRADAPLTQVSESAAEYWTVDQIARYFVKFHRPQGNDENGPITFIPWRLNYKSNLAFPVYNDQDDKNPRPILERPILDPTNKDVQQCLAELLNRRRLYGWRVTIDQVLGQLVEVSPSVYGKTYANESEKGAAEIDIFRLLSEKLSLTTGGTIFANDRKKTISLNTNQITELSIRETIEGKFDQVIVRGARQRVIFSVKTGVGQYLVKGWHSDGETSYNQGASQQTGYAAKQLEEKRRLNETIRQDLSLSHVFARYFPSDSRIDSPKWEVKTTGTLLIDVTEGTAADANKFLSLLGRLPISTPNDKDAEIGSQPLVWIKDLDGVYRLANEIAVQNELLGAFGQRTWACGVNVEQGTPFLWVRATPQHALGKNTFTPLAEDETIETAIDYKNEILATLAIETESYCEGVYPTYVNSVRDVVRQNVIDFGPTYFYDRMAPYTRTGERNDDGTLKESGSQWTTIRDDRETLADFAKVLYEWQSKTRRDVDVTFDRILLEIDVGDLLTSIGEGAAKTEVNAVVTEIRYTFGDRQSTSIHTDHGELDYTQLIEPSGTSIKGGGGK